MASALPVERREEKEAETEKIKGDSFIRLHLRKLSPYQPILPFEVQKRNWGRGRLILTWSREMLEEKRLAGHGLGSPFIKMEVLCEGPTIKEMTASPKECGGCRVGTHELEMEIPVGSGKGDEEAPCG